MPTTTRAIHKIWGWPSKMMKKWKLLQGYDLEGATCNILYGVLEYVNSNIQNAHLCSSPTYSVTFKIDVTPCITYINAQLIHINALLPLELSMLWSNIHTKLYNLNNSIVTVHHEWRYVENGWNGVTLVELVNRIYIWYSVSKSETHLGLLVNNNMTEICA